MIYPRTRSYDDPVQIPEYKPLPKGNSQMSSHKVRQDVKRQAGI